MKFNFKDKVVVITGAGGVLCSQMALEFARNGAKVAGISKGLEGLEKLAQNAKKEGLEIKIFQGDVLDKQSLEKVKKEINKTLGKCEILINGAGGNNPKATTGNEYEHLKNEGDISFFDLDPCGIDLVFSLNFQGTLLPTQVFASDMLENKKGVILNISSMNAYRPLTKIPAYSAAKAGISNFTQWLSVYFAKSGIRCNAIAPGFIVSNQNKNLLFNEDGSPTKRSEKILRNTPMERFVDSKELLGGVLFLCDDNLSSAITGVVLPIDCGFSAYSGV